MDRVFFFQTIGNCNAKTRATCRTLVKQMLLLAIGTPVGKRKLKTRIVQYYFTVTRVFTLRLTTGVVIVSSNRFYTIFLTVM